MIDGARGRAASWIAGALAVTALAAVFVASRHNIPYDSQYALLTSEALLTRGSWNVAPLLREEVVRELRETQQGAPFQRDHWQLEPLPDGRVIYRYPPGTPLFSVPFVAVARPLGGSTLGADGRYSSRRELGLQRLLAALVAAATALAVHRLALRELPLGPATAVALVAGLGGPLWSTASRALWPHTWTALWVSLALLELLRWEDGERRRPVLLALFASAAFWARPTAALVAAPVALFVALRHRAAFVRLAATGAVAFASYLLLTKVVWSSWAPAYAQVLGQGRLRHPGALLLQMTVSVRGGLFVYSPVLLAVAMALLFYGIARERRPFAYLALGIVAAHLTLYAFWYWPEGVLSQRFLTELTPCFAWLGAHAWSRVREASRERPRNAARRFGVRLAVALLALASVAAHATGAIDMRWPNLYARMRFEGEIADRGGPPPTVRPLRRGVDLPQWVLLRWLATEWWPGPPAGARR